MCIRTDTAVILAAGMGTRLNKRGTWYPKGFVRLGGLPMIEEMVILLAEAGIDRIIVVTGHLAHFYDSLGEAYPGLIEIVRNPRYAESGTMYSLYCVRDWIDRDFLLLESDLTFERRAVSAPLDFTRDNVVLMSGHTNAGDEVYIETHDGLLAMMSKNRGDIGDSTSGEFVGISKISLPLLRVMCEEAELSFATGLRVSYDTDCLVAAARRYPVYCLLVDDLAWSEIDCESQLQNTVLRVYPRILDRDGARQWPSRLSCRPVVDHGEDYGR
jgi:2-aminoethylphosphonate-pyruvate transaminase